MRVELLPLVSLTARDLAAWRELASVALEPNPFFEPEYVLPLARGVSQLDTVALAVVRDGEAWAACGPVRRAAHWHRIPLPSVSLWRGHPLYSLLGTPLIALDRADAAASALVAALVHQPSTFFTGLDWLVEGGPVHRALLTAFIANDIRWLRFESFERAFTIRRPQPDYLERATSKRHLKNVDRKARRLHEQFGSELQVVDRAGEDAAVVELIELEGRSHLAERGTVLRSDPDHAQFFRAMCEGFAAQGRLQLLSLQAGALTLAMSCNIVAGPGIFCIKIAYDERYKSLAPGIHLAVETTRVFHDDTDAAWMDSCSSADNETNNRMMPDRRPLVSLVAVEPTVRALVTVPTVRTVRRLRDRVIEAHQRDRQK